MIVFLFLLFLFFLFVATQIAMLLNRKPGVKLFDVSIFGNPFVIQYYGRRYLTERGIFWRNISWVALAVIIISLLVLRQLAKSAPFSLRAE
jgi:ABC-type branched-subunit amino acid transport system permease subunit